MQYQPYTYFEVKTQYSSAEICELLSKKTVKNNSPWFDSIGNYPFRGEVNQGSFKIRPIIRYRNSFLPVINGTIAEKEGETVVQITMRLDRFIELFSYFWSGMVLFVLLSSILSAFFDPESNRSGAIGIAVVLFAVERVLTHCAFWAEAQKAREKLEKLLQAKINADA